MARTGGQSKGDAIRTAGLTGLSTGISEALRGEGVEELYPLQAEIVEAGPTDSESLTTAIPTTNGKALITELAVLPSVARDGKALYIVPLRTLAPEKKAEFERWEEHSIDVGVSTSNYESDGEWLSPHDIVVTMSEKVDSLVRNNAAWMDQLTRTAVDEARLIDDRHRGLTPEVTLAKLRQLNVNLQVVALSVTVGNVDVASDQPDAELVKSDWRPIDLKIGTHYGNAISFADGSQREVPIGRGERQTPALVADVLEDDGEGN